ncbi:MAG: HAMP domain-containing sensor histidine kinase, partial [bacterium]|nr:HAMP domain-containing sensor histidine kinase [bacterium]
FIISFFCLLLYRFMIGHLKEKRYVDLFFSLLLILMSGLLLIYSNHMMGLLFLDIPILLGYLKKHRFDSILLSILFIFIIIQKMPMYLLFYVAKYCCYLIGDILLHHKSDKLFQYFIWIQSFFLTYFSFQYYVQNVSITLLMILGISVSFYFLLTWLLALLNLQYEDYSLNKWERDKSIFKITHEIKNPIAVCKGYLDMLDIRDANKVERYIPVIKSEINRTLIIMEDFLTLNNMSIRKEILDIYLLIEDVQKTTERLLQEKGIMLKVPSTLDELYLIGDYDRLKQVFINLIKNAYEAHATVIEIHLSVKKNQLKIVIQDNGEGMDAVSLKRLGEIFYTTKQSGTGIGVSLSREIISLHHGDIHYQSKVHEGTSATIMLPVEVGLLS